MKTGRKSASYVESIVYDACIDRKDGSKSLVAHQRQHKTDRSLPSDSSTSGIPACTSVVPLARFSRRVCNHQVEKAFQIEFLRTPAKYQLGGSVFQEWRKERELDKPSGSLSDSELNQTLYMK